MATGFIEHEKLGRGNQVRRDEEEVRARIAAALPELSAQLLGYALSLASVGPWRAWDAAQEDGVCCESLPGDLCATGDPRVTALAAAAGAVEHALELLER